MKEPSHAHSHVTSAVTVFSYLVPVYPSFSLFLFRTNFSHTVLLSSFHGIMWTCCTTLKSVSNSF